MSTYNIRKKRIDNYCKLSNYIARLSSKELKLLLAKTKARAGWGKSHTVKIGTSRVFVKTIPITEYEYDNMYSTKNIYSLPTFYNYGVGSAGFGAFREIVTHIKTTNWVLGGKIDNFPLMYHYRICPAPKKQSTTDNKDVRRYVRYWNENKNIGNYTKKRNRAKYQAVVFLEYIPHVLADWLPKNFDKLENIVRDMRHTIAFLRKNGIVHFDVHFWNILTDGHVPYLTDFGLVLDKSFELRSQERKFLSLHSEYDLANFSFCLGSYVYAAFDELSTARKEAVRRKYDIKDDTGFAQTLAILLQNLKALHANELSELDARYVKQVIKDRGVIGAMNEFFRKMRLVGKKSTRYPYQEIRRMLRK